MEGILKTLSDKRLSFKQKIILSYLNIVRRIARRHGLMNSIQKSNEPLRDYRVHDIELPKEIEVLVIVPVLVSSEKGLKQLKNLVDSLIEQKTDLNYYVVIVDDGSTMNYSIDKKHVQVYKLDKNYGPASARNVGFELARQFGVKYVAFTDSDCIVAENWIQCLYDGLGSHAVAGGMTLSKNPDSWIGFYHDYYGSLNGRIMEDGILYIPSCNMIVNVVLLENPFDETYKKAAFEDAVFSLENKDIVIAYDAIVYHDYGSLYNQFYKYAQLESVFLEEHSYFVHLFPKSRFISNVKFENQD